MKRTFVEDFAKTVLTEEEIGKIHPFEIKDGDYVLGVFRITSNHANMSILLFRRDNIWYSKTQTMTKGINPKNGKYRVGLNGMARRLDDGSEDEIMQAYVNVLTEMLPSSMDILFDPIKKNSMDGFKEMFVPARDYLEPEVNNDTIFVQPKWTDPLHPIRD